MSEKITVKIEPNGSTQVSVTGVRGKGCQDLTAGLEADLGTVVSDVKTEEYNAKANNDLYQQQR